MWVREGRAREQEKEKRGEGIGREEEREGERGMEGEGWREREIERRVLRGVGWGKRGAEVGARVGFDQYLAPTPHHHPS